MGLESQRALQRLEMIESRCVRASAIYFIFHRQTLELTVVYYLEMSL